MDKEKNVPMISADKIKEVVKEWIRETDCFLVDVKIKPGNAIVVEIDRNEGMDVDTCAELSRCIEQTLDREVEDYELEVGSAGITSPFKVTEQYQKNIGNEVEVLTKAGQKLTGVLKEVSEECFIITQTKKVKIEGSKRKAEVQENVSLRYDEVKQTKYLIRFK